MCTRTKTSFGCGHCVKTTQDCGIPECEFMERWKFPKFMDCAKCRASGEVVTRGKDGRGRHGREIARHKESRRSSAEAITPAVESPGTPNMTISPWASESPEVPQEKHWDTATRLKADDAWLVEHGRRMSDLEEKTSKLSVRSSKSKSRRTTPRGSYERVIHANEVEEPEEYDDLPAHPKGLKLLAYEVEEPSHLPPRRRSRKASHDSEGSMPHYQESPMPRTPRRKTHFVPPITEHNHHEHHDHHEYHEVYRIPRHPVARAETYHHHHQQPASYFESPVSGSPVTPGEWPQQYQFVQPLQHNPYYARTYPVY